MNLKFWVATTALAMTCVGLAPTVLGQSTTNRSVGVLKLVNGDRLHGQLEVIAASGTLLWKHPEADAPIEFNRNVVAGMELNAERPPTQANVELRLTNGDSLSGTLDSCDAEFVSVRTWFAGTLKIPRKRVQMIIPLFAAKPPVFAGPRSLDGWTLGKVTAPDAGEGGKWKYSNNSFYASRSASIARDVGLPDMARVEFDMEWRGFFHLAVALFTDYLHPISLPNKETEPDFGGFYSLQINSYSANLIGIRQFEPLRQLGQVPFGAFKRQSTAHFDIRVNTTTRTIVLIIDGVVTRTWVDPQPFAGRGTGLRFVHQGQGSVRLSNLKVSEWDGLIEERLTPVNGLKFDLVRLRNGDKVFGTLERIQNDRILINRTGGAPALEIPLERVRQVEFPIVDFVSPPAHPDITAELAQEARLVLQLQSWTAEGVRVRSVNFGEAIVNPAAFTKIDFIRQ